MSTDWITPDWPASDNIQAISTSRNGGVSNAPWNSMNPASHTDDNPENVRENRRILTRECELPSEPLWLTQVHGNRVVDVASAKPGTRADGSFAKTAGAVCAVMTADCLPVLMCDMSGSQVAALHAGWRGLAGGVLESGVAKFLAPESEILAWLGPCIGPDAFEVGEDVRAAFLKKSSDMAAAFKPATRTGHWFADLHMLAKLTLARAGVRDIYVQPDCTYRDPHRYFSYRRDGVCGRMASLIWLEASDNGEE